MSVRLAIILTLATSMPTAVVAGAQSDEVAPTYFTQPRAAPVEVTKERIALRKTAAMAGDAITAASRGADSLAGQFIGALIGDVLHHNGTAPEHDYVDVDGFFWHGLNEEPPMPKGALLLKIHITGGCEARLLPQEFWRVLVGAEKSLAISAPEKLVRKYVERAKAQVERILQSNRRNCLAEFRPVIENVPEVYYPRSGVRRSADSDEVPVTDSLQLPPFPVDETTDGLEPVTPAKSVEDSHKGISKPEKTKWWPFGKPKGSSSPTAK